MQNIYNKLATAVLSLALAGTAQAQQTPADAQSGAITLTGATIHVGDGTVIENGSISFDDGIITAVGPGANGAGTVINVAGKHIYPGFIAPNTSLGLVEISSVRATDDEDEIGDYLPHVRSIVAYNTESKVVESMRPNGVLLGQIAPRGGVISGTSSVVQFDAWNYEDSIISEDDGIHMNWPSSFRRTGWWAEPGPTLPNKEYSKQLDAARTFLLGAKAYDQNGSKESNLKYGATKGLYDGSQRLFVHVNGEKEILDAIELKKELGIQHMVLVGGYGAHKIAGDLKKENIPVLAQRVHDLPGFDDEDYDLPYRMPMILSKAGVLVGLENAGSMERHQMRNLPFYAGTTAGYGMNKEEALKLVTSNTAKILGIDDRYGSLEVGKSATLFVSDGDALDMRGNMLRHAFIDGRKISLDTHQSELYERYSNKYKHTMPSRN